MPPAFTVHLQAGVTNELMLEYCRQYKQVLCVVSATEHFTGCSLSKTFQAHINMSGGIAQSTKKPRVTGCCLLQRQQEGTNSCGVTQHNFQRLSWLQT